MTPPTAASSALALPLEDRIARRGAVSGFLAWTDGLPGHGWWVFPVIAALLFGWAHLIVWATGRLPVGTIEPTITAGIVYGPYLLALLAAANLVAGRSLRAFWPATGWPESDRPAWAAAFANTPPPWGWVSIAIGVPLAIASFLSAPASFLGPDAERPSLFLAYLPALVLGYAMAPAALVHTVRQLRLVARIHREATAIDPFDREPVYAFSRLTVLMGLGYVLIGYYTLTVNGAFAAGSLVTGATLTFSVAVGVATFLVPLWGIHDRLVHEKEHLLRQVDDRYVRLSAEIYRRIDAGEYDGTKVVSDSLGAVTVMRERIHQLPTWPWPPQLLRGFVSALLLPLVIYSLTRLVATQVG